LGKDKGKGRKGGKRKEGKVKDERDKRTPHN